MRSSLQNCPVWIEKKNAMTKLLFDGQETASIFYHFFGGKLLHGKSVTDITHINEQKHSSIYVYIKGHVLYIILKVKGLWAHLA